MKVTIDIDKRFSDDILNELINGQKKNYQNVYDQIRQTFKSIVENKLRESGLEPFPKEIRKSVKKGVKGYELNVINRKLPWDDSKFIDLDYYMYHTGFDSGSGDFDTNVDNTHLSYLPSHNSFLKVDSYSIGNVLCVVENKDLEISINNTGKLKVVGYTYDISKKNRKSYIGFYGLHFDNDFIRSNVSNLINKCDCKPEHLDETRIEFESFPITYICRICGKLYTCSCFYDEFKEYSKTKKVVRDHYHDDLKYKINNIGVKENLCHLCTKETPRIRYGSPMYYSSFNQVFLPYYHLYTFRKYKNIFHFEKNDNKDTENELRDYFDYPRIGEKWINETHLYKTICSLFPEHEVIFHYRGSEMEGLELDIFIPELNLGIEYQGEQHYKPIQHFGGEEGLKKRIDNDKKKKRICKSIGYDLIEYKHDEEVSEKTVVRKLRKYIG